MQAATPENEADRLKALQRYQILDTPPDPGFDRLTALVARLLAVPIAQVTLVDEQRQWFKASYGQPRGETPREWSFCAHAIAADEDVLVVPDATNDPRFFDNPLVSGEPRIRAYAGAPVKSRDGFNLGTVCAIDTVPRDFTAEKREILRDLAAIAADELELRLAMNECGRSANELHESLERLKKAETQRDELTQMIIHDLGSPLTSVRENIDVLALTAAGKFDASELRCLTEAQQGARDLNDLISGLLDVSRLEAGEMALKKDVHDLVRIVHKASARFSAVLQGRAFTCDVPNEPVLLACDSELIQRILENLIINAVKFTKTDGQLHISVDQYGKEVTISVSDHGPGIPGDQQNRIFEKFRQTTTGDEHRHSSRLGLTFCKVAVEAHGGKFAVQDEPGRGTTLSVVLPSLGGTHTIGSGLVPRAGESGSFVRLRSPFPFRIPSPW